MTREQPAFCEKLGTVENCGVGCHSLSHSIATGWYKFCWNLSNGKIFFQSNHKVGDIPPGSSTNILCFQEKQGFLLSSPRGRAAPGSPAPLLSRDKRGENAPEPTVLNSLDRSLGRRHNDGPLASNDLRRNFLGAKKFFLKSCTRSRNFSPKGDYE